VARRVTGSTRCRSVLFRSVRRREHGLNGPGQLRRAISMMLSNAAERVPTAQVFMKSRLHSTRQNGRAAQRYIEPASRYTAGHFGDGQSIALQTTNLCDKLEQVVGVIVATGRITAWLCPVALAAECTEKQSTSRTTAHLWPLRTCAI